MRGKRITLKITIPKLSKYQKVYYFIWGIYSYMAIFMQFSELAYTYDLAVITRLIEIAISLALLLMLIINRYTGKKINP